MCISSPGAGVPQVLYCCALPAASQLNSCRSCQDWYLGLAAVPFSLGGSTSTGPAVQSQAKNKLPWTHAYPVPGQCGGTVGAKSSGSCSEETSQVQLLLDWFDGEQQLSSAVTRWLSAALVVRPVWPGLALPQGRDAGAWSCRVWSWLEPSCRDTC